eukprot:scaffold320247_cov23-Prasinocladus_malaysianus.AAC.1
MTLCDMMITAHTLSRKTTGNLIYASTAFQSSKSRTRPTDVDQAAAGKTQADEMTSHIDDNVPLPCRQGKATGSQCHGTNAG